MSNDLQIRSPADGSRFEIRGLGERLECEARAAAAILGTTAMALVLASRSPRRHELLGMLLARFEVAPADILEVPRPRETARQFASRAAREKAAHVAAQYPGHRVLGADTVVVVDERIFGKPSNRAEARGMLQTLSGRTHRVVTAIALAVSGGDVDELLVETEVSFRPLSRDEIDRYVDTGEPFDKAGAYAVQGGGGLFVNDVVGSYSNVIGLPLVEVARLLTRGREAGTPVHG
jgi:septum formation protein